MLQLLTLLFIIIFFVPSRAKGYVALISIAIGAIVAVSGAACSVLGVWVPYLPSFDVLSSLFVLIISIVGIAVATFAVGYIDGEQRRKSSISLSLHFASMVVLFYALLGVAGATQRYDFLLWWELMTIASFVLVIFDSSRKEVMHSAISYLVLMHVGFFFLLGGFTMLDGELLFGYGAMPIAVWLLFLIGFGLKAALFPLHSWLPGTYSAAHPHVAAMMSGGTTSVALYGIVRATLAADDMLSVGGILFALGIITAIYGAAMAVRDSDLKRLLGFSTIENVGVVLLALGLGVVGKATANDVLAYCGFAGALLHIMGHASYKTMLFLSAGSVFSAARTTDMNKLGGLFKRMPLTGWFFGAGTMSISAMPGFVGFFSEFIIYIGLFVSIANGSAPLVGILGIVVMSLVSGVSVMTFAKAFGITMLGEPRSEQAAGATEVKKMMNSAFILPLISVLVGGIAYGWFIFGSSDALFGVNVADFNMLGMMWWVEIAVGVLVALCGGFYILRHYLQRDRVISRDSTWRCGYDTPTSQMQYTASSLSDQLSRTTQWSTKTAAKKSPTANIMARMMRRWSSRLALFQTGKTNHYILHALLFFVLILILSIIGAI